MSVHYLHQSSLKMTLITYNRLSYNWLLWQPVLNHFIHWSVNMINIYNIRDYFQTNFAIGVWWFLIDVKRYFFHLCIWFGYIAYRLSYYIIMNYILKASFSWEVDRLQESGGTHIYAFRIGTTFHLLVDGNWCFHLQTCKYIYMCRNCCNVLYKYKVDRWVVIVKVAAVGVVSIK